MSTTVDPLDIPALQRIEAAALLLNPEERAELTERLWTSEEGNEPSDPVWDAEIKRRMQEVDSGAVQCRPWEDVMAELRAKHQG
jgi:putative addiction module component (TIGR02574 family)